MLKVDLNMIRMSKLELDSLKRKLGIELMQLEDVSRELRLAVRNDNRELFKGIEREKNRLLDNLSDISRLGEVLEKVSEIYDRSERKNVERGLGYNCFREEILHPIPFVKNFQYLDVLLRDFEIM